MTETAEGEQHQPTTQSVVDTSVFANYIKRAVQLHLEDGDDTPASLNSILKEEGTLETLRKFLSDAQASVLFIERIVSKG